MMCTTLTSVYPSRHLQVWSSQAWKHPNMPLWRQLELVVTSIEVSRVSQTSEQLHCIVLGAEICGLELYTWRSLAFPFSLGLFVKASNGNYRIRPRNEWWQYLHCLYPLQCNTFSKAQFTPDRVWNCCYSKSLQNTGCICDAITCIGTPIAPRLSRVKSRWNRNVRLSSKSWYSFLSDNIMVRLGCH